MTSGFRRKTIIIAAHLRILPVSRSSGAAIDRKTPMVPILLNREPWRARPPVRTDTAL
jgi:hypothetical protein